ncbi:MAG: hypothetical protein JWQ38_389 [Flavipsychrobacter sp.]|nr:hypothetical protein [Flavipsychrobacter sp.]
MKIIEQLASSLGRRDEIPNQELAQHIANSKDKSAVKELVDNLSNKSKDIQSDCIKVIYEIGTIDPKLIADYHADLVKLLDNKNNRLQWGAMTALNSIATEKPEIIFKALPKLVAVAEQGSVITKDNLMAILTKLCAMPKYAADAFALFNEQLLTCPTNQLPMYAENALPIINEKNKATFIKTLTSRLDEIEKDTKRKRVEKVIKKVEP